MEGPTSSVAFDRVSYLHSPVGRIDLDTLRHIFEYIAEDNRPKYGRPVSRSWIGIGHVCRKWRSLLLSMPQLWARDVLAFGTGSALDDIVDRTQDIPLHLDGLEHSSRILDLQRIAPLVSRAVVLKCNFVTLEEQNAVLDNLLRHPPTVLHTLSISSYSRARHIPNPTPSYATCIEHLPIYHLAMHDIYLKPSLLGYLTSWVMTSDELAVIVDRRLTVDAILDVLAHNTGLETLSFTDAISFRNQEVLDPRLVLLPALKVLHIWQNRNVSPYLLLNFLQFPNPTLERYTIHDTVIDTTDGLSVALSSGLAACVQSPALQSPRFLRVECAPHLNGKVLVQLETRHCVTDAHAHHVPFHIQLDRGFWEASCLDISSAILGCLIGAHIPEQITQLSWNVLEEEATTTSYWDMVLQPFKAVKTLIILDAYEHREAVLNAMFMALTHEPLLLPHLYRVVLRARETIGMGNLRDRPGLQIRREMGAPIREVVFLDVGDPEIKHIEGNAVFDRTVREQMEELGAQLGVAVESRECWEEVGGKRYFQGTEFTFSHQQNTTAVVGT